MAQSMMERRREAERQRNEAYRTTLRQVFTAARRPPEFERALEEARAGLAGYAIRDGALWRPKLKTRDAARLRLAAARYLYARYTVAAHLEQVWLDGGGADAAETALRKRWYATVARGDSLYRAGAAEWLSRREVHAFLHVPPGLDFNQAVWFGIARGCTGDARLALRIARSRIAQAPRREAGFWREAVRFFCANPTGAEEMDDLCDFIAQRRARPGGFSLKGRTLASLRGLSNEWHRDVVAMARMEEMRRRFAGHPATQEGRWAGSPLADWSWQPPGREAKARREEFVMVQLTGAGELLAESRAMHHCVWTYAGKCLAGQASIWSLRHRMAGKDTARLLTVELNREHRAVQVRGFANRLAGAEERKVLERWAQARGVAL